MNILATSDIHGNRSVYKNLSYRAKKSDIDIVIIAGDLTSFNIDNKEEEEIKSILNNIRKPVLFIMGNDDNYEWKSDNYLVNINENQFTYQNISFVGYQYSNPFIGGQFEKNEENQRQDLLRLSKIVDDRTVFVTHNPCNGILDKVNDMEHLGSQALKNVIVEKKPKLHIFGHIHECFGVYENHFNVSYPDNKMCMKINYNTLNFEYIKI